MAMKEEMGGPPTGDEVVAALLRIKVGKAAGGNGLLPDIVKCCGGQRKTTFQASKMVTRLRRMMRALEQQGRHHQGSFQSNALQSRSIPIAIEEIG